MDASTVVLWVLAVLGICAFLLLFVMKLVRRRYKFPTPALIDRSELLEDGVFQGLVQLA